MSLVKRIWILVVFITLAASLLSIGINMMSAKNYLENEIKVKNIDTANALAMSISQNATDVVMAEMLVNSQFDLGHYKQIELSDVAGKLIVRREHEKMRASPVPNWFAQMVHIDPAPGEAAVQSGWKQLGTIRLQSDPSFAYDSIWSSALTLLWWFAAGCMAVGLLSTLFIRTIIKPLNRVVDQAEALAERKFIEIKPPSTLEFKLIVNAMNRLTRKIKSLLDDESARLEKLKTAYEVDKLTGFSVRDVHLRRVQSHIEREDTHVEGLLLLIHIGNLEELNRELGRMQSDQQVKALAQAMAELFADHPDCWLGRLNGPDFSLLLPGATDSPRVIQELKAHLALQEGLQLLRLSYAFVHYTVGSTLPELLSACDKNLIPLSADMGSPAAAEPTAQRSASEWKKILDTALADGEFFLAHFPVRGPHQELLHTEAPARIQSSVAQETLVAGAFLPWAKRLGQGGQIDLAILRLALKFAQTNAQGICVNLGFESVCDARNVDSIVEVLSQHKAHAKFVHLDIPEELAFDRFDEFRRFCERVAPLGCRIGVEHLDRHIGHLGRLHSLGLNYLKVSHALVKDIREDTAAQTLLRGLCTISHTLGVQIIAEGVSHTDDIELLYAIGFDGLTGSAVQ